MTGTITLWNERKDDQCYYCARDMDKPTRLTGRKTELTATTDHLIPQSRGGSNARGNLVLACNTCNHIKGSLTFDEFTIAVMFLVGSGRGLVRRLRSYVPLENTPEVVAFLGGLSLELDRAEAA